MGREIRNVPATWVHPFDFKTKRHVPLYGRSFASSLAGWEKDREQFERGLWCDGEPLPESAKGLSFEEWNGGKPREEDYMPAWPDSERTHCQMYETTSEGTPISPVFATAEECAKWCADNGASAFGGMTADLDWWLSVAKGAAGFGASISAEGMRPL